MNNNNNWRQPCFVFFFFVSFNRSFFFFHFILFGSDWCFFFIRILLFSSKDSVTRTHNSHSSNSINKFQNLTFYYLIFFSSSHLSFSLLNVTTAIIVAATRSSIHVLLSNKKCDCFNYIVYASKNKTQRKNAVMITAWWGEIYFRFVSRDFVGYIQLFVSLFLSLFLCWLYHLIGILYFLQLAWFFLQCTMYIQNLFRTCDFFFFNFII